MLRTAALALVLVAAASTACVEFNADCSPPLDGNPEEVVTWLAEPIPIERNTVRTKENALGNAMADAYLAAMRAGDGPKPTIAVENAGAIRDLGLCITRPALAKGALTRRVLKDTIPFSNQLVTVKVSERTLFDILEHSVATIAVPGISPGGQFLQVSGLSYEVDCKNRPEQLSNVNGQVVREQPGTRVLSITLGGKTITRETADNAENVVIALNDFLAGGGDNYVDFQGRTVTPSNPERYTYNVLEEYLKALPATQETPARLAVSAEKPRIVLKNCE